MVKLPLKIQKNDLIYLQPAPTATSRGKPAAKQPWTRVRNKDFRSISEEFKGSNTEREGGVICSYFQPNLHVSQV